MLLLRYLTAVICAVFISTGAISGEYVLKAVGDQVYFCPDNFVPPVTSIIWKHINTDGNVDKVIEWEAGATETWIPIQRFKNITTVDEKTGQITITNLKVEHSGVYTIDINSKEQEQRFTLTVEERVPKPVIEVVIKGNPDVHLRCKNSEKIIWKNSTGETLKGSKLHLTGQSITVKNEGNPKQLYIKYTCILYKGTSKQTRDLDGLDPGLMLMIIAILIILVFNGSMFCFMYKITKNLKALIEQQQNNFCSGAK